MNNGATTNGEGQKKKGGRLTSSEAQLDEIIDYVAALVARRLPKSAVNANVREWVRKNHGIEAVSIVTLQVWASRARALLVERSNKSPQEHRNEAHAFYESIIQHSRSDRDRLHAQERIDRLFGLEAPQKFIGTFKGKVSRPDNMTDEELDDFIGGSEDGDQHEDGKPTAEGGAGAIDGEPGAGQEAGGPDEPSGLHDVHQA